MPIARDIKSRRGRADAIFGPAFFQGGGNELESEKGIDIERDYFREDYVLRILNITRGSLKNMISQGRGPHGVVQVGKSYYFSKQCFHEWFLSREKKTG
jgi:hypothetical protein